MSQNDQIEGRKKCILIVDDEQVICEMLAFFFEKNGFETLQAYDTAEALALAQAHTIDLLLSDFYLPKGNGFELVRRIRSVDGSTPPTIFMSGNISDVSIEKAQPLGVVAILEKPINFALLLSEVHKALPVV